MKYETPKATVLTPAISAIQNNTSQAPKLAQKGGDGATSQFNEGSGGYMDWE